MESSDITPFTHPVGKIVMYDMFLKDTELQYLLVIGEGGTGKSFSLTRALKNNQVHSEIHILYGNDEDSEPTILSATDESLPIKYITHRLSLSDSEKEEYLAKHPDAWIIKFVGQFPKA